MKNRYWFVVLNISTGTKTGIMNVGVTTSNGKHFSSEKLKALIAEANEKGESLRTRDLVVTNFIEFKTEHDFKDFLGGREGYKM